MANDRHFTLKTVDGKTEEIYCREMDDTDQHEMLFIRDGEPAPLKFRKTAIVSYQEHPPFDRKKWNDLVRENNRIYEQPGYQDPQ